jgi:hypothetical protein
MDRAHQTIRVVEKAERAYLDGTNEAKGISKSEYLFAMTEALELRDVHRAFQDHPSQELRDRLERALKEPVLPELEASKTRRPEHNVRIGSRSGTEAVRGQRGTCRARHTSQDFNQELPCRV